MRLQGNLADILRTQDIIPGSRDSAEANDIDGGQKFRYYCKLMDIERTERVRSAHL